MKKCNALRWLRTMIALLVVLSMVLCGCAEAGTDGGDGDGKLEAQDAVDSLTNIYGALLSALGGNRPDSYGYEMDMLLTLGQDLRTQLENTLKQSEMDFDMSWLENVGLHMHSGYNGDLMRMVIEAQLNGKQLVSAETIMDMVGGMVYVSAPELNDQALGMEVDMSQMQGASQQANQLLAEYAEFLKDMPSEKELNAVLTRYLNLVIESLDPPTTGSKELHCEAIGQEVTTTTYNISAYDVLDIASKLLTTAKTDAELEKLLDAFSQVANQIGAKQSAEQGVAWTDVDLYQEILNAIDPALQNIADSKADMEDAEFLIVELYGDSESQQGFTIFVNGIVYARLYMLEYDTNTSFYLNLGAGVIEIGGWAVTWEGKTKGEYTLSSNGSEMLFVELKDFDAAALEKGELQGIVRLKLGSGLISKLPLDFPVNRGTLLELELDVDGQVSKVKANIYQNEILLFAISLTTKTADPGKIYVPANYVNMQDSDAMEQWAKGLKFDGVLANLSAAGVPNELVDLLKQSIENAMSGGGAYDEPVSMLPG